MADLEVVPMLHHMRQIQRLICITIDQEHFVVLETMSLEQ